MDLFNIDDLVSVVDSKYSLCICLAKRSRELGAYIVAKRNMERINIMPPLVEIDSNDPLEIAIQELKEKKISFTRVKDGIK
jgi:DNA-directed RNA polymerase omega subunit